MNKIIKNMMLSAFLHKVQTICLIVLVLLGSSFFVGINASNQMANQEYHKLKEESGAHTMILDLNQTDIVSKSSPIDQNPQTNFYKKLNDALNKISNSTFPSASFKNIKANWSIIDSREVFPINDNANTNLGIFKVIPYGVPNEKKVNDLVINNVDKPIIIDGRAPKNANEIMISPKYAHIHHIKLNQNITIGAEYKVVGYAVSYDMLFPEFDILNKVPDSKSEAVIYAYHNAYFEGNNFETTSPSDRDVYAVFRPTDVASSKTVYPDFNYEAALQKIFDSVFSKDNKIIDSSGDFKDLNNALYYNYDNKNYAFYARTNSFNIFVAKSQEFLTFFMIILLVTSIFIILIITRKRVYQDLNTIGIFKANGYYTWEISSAYLMFSIISSFIGVLLGTIFSLLTYEFVYNSYLSFFMLPNFGVPFSAYHLLINALIANIAIILFTIFVTYAILFFNIRGSTIKIINKAN